MLHCFFRILWDFLRYFAEFLRVLWDLARFSGRGGILQVSWDSCGFFRVFAAFSQCFCEFSCLFCRVTQGFFEGFSWGSCGILRYSFLRAFIEFLWGFVGCSWDFCMVFLGLFWG